MNNQGQEEEAAAIQVAIAALLKRARKHRYLLTEISSVALGT